MPSPEARHRARVALLAALSATNIADGIGAVALPLLALQETRSPTQISIVSVAVLTPRVIAQVPAGLVVARFGLIRVLVSAMIGQALLYASAAILLTVGAFGLPHILGCTLLSSCIGVIFDLAASAAVPSLCTAPDLHRFVANLVLAENISSSLIGAPLGGVLVAASLAGSLGATSAVYLGTAAAFLALFSRRRLVGPTPAGISSRAIRMGEAWTWFRRQRLLRRLVMLDALIAAAAAANGALLVLFASERLSAGPAEFGALVTGTASGSMIAATYLKRERGKQADSASHPRRSTQLRVAGAGLSAAFVALGSAQSLAVAWALLALVGIFLTLWQTTTTAAALRLIATNARPQLLAIRTTCITTAAVVGSIAAGWLTGAVDFGATLAVAGLACLIATGGINRSVNQIPHEYIDMPAREPAVITRSTAT